MDALLGHTGFVGGNLLGQHAFGARFNSRTIGDAAGARFGTVVCAAAPATMWAANREPEKDRAVIDDLIRRLHQIRAERFVLISTIAVLADPAAGADEGTEHFEEANAYGRNRRLLEMAAAALFPRCHILRLPALYGTGLKKNFIYDLINPVPSFLTDAKYSELAAALPRPAKAALANAYYWSDEVRMHVCDRSRCDSGERTILASALARTGFTAVNFTHPDSTFQFYGLDRLWSDIECATEAGLPVLHLAPQPLRAGTVHLAVTGRPMTETSARPVHEDMRTRHASLWGRTDGYVRGRDSVLNDLRAFCAGAAAA